MKIKALTSAVLSGLLRPMLGDVNVVSAPVVAKERGMIVDEVVRAAQSDYESLITVTVTTERQERSVSGTVYARRQAAPGRHQGHPGRCRIRQVDDLCDQRGQAGLHRRFASLLGDAKINIATFHLGRVKQGGDAIALVEVDGAVPPECSPRCRRCRRSSRPRRWCSEAVIRTMTIIIFRSAEHAVRASPDEGRRPVDLRRTIFVAAGKFCVGWPHDTPHSAISKGEKHA